MATVDINSTSKFCNKFHSSVLLSRLQDQRKTGKFCDVTLKMHDKLLLAHRSVLCACSPYFDAAFSSGMTESRDGVIDLECVDTNAMERLLNYMYTGTISISEDELESTLQAVDYLGIGELRDFCATFAESIDINVNNCFILKQISCRYNLMKLLRKITLYIQQHFHDVLESGEYLTLTCQSLIEFLEDDNNLVETIHNGEIVTGEESLLEAIVKWVRFADGRQEHFLTLLSKCVRFYAIRKNDLGEFIQKCSHLREDMAMHKGLNFLSEQLAYGANSQAIAAKNTRRRGNFARVIAVCSSTNTLRESNLFYANLLEERRWVALANLPALTFEAAATMYCGSLYVCGGLAKTGKRSIVRNTMYWYDPMLNAWKELSPMLKAVQRHSVTACNNCIYVIGGLETHVVSTVMQCYNVDADQWTTRTSLPAARCDALAFSSEPFVYVIGGWESSHFTDSQCSAPPCRYNTITDTWETLPSVPIFRVITGRSWVLEIKKNNSYLLTDFKGKGIRFSSATGEWTEMSDTCFKLKLGASVKMCCVVDDPPPSRVLALSSCRSFYVWDGETGQLLERRPPSPQKESDVAITLPCQFGCAIDIPVQFLT
ncbi:ring canal kelch protein-like [Ptychodera flava]|uniref:ring canal kelch protein-like n=1 Tax=Ptychodera flava TaxID=63121 RepID=UPI00396A159A